MREGWTTSKVQDILVKTETINPTKTPNKEFTYIDISGVNNQSFSIEATTHLRGKDAPSRARKLIKTNDIIFATVRPTLRRIAIVPKNLNDQVCSTGYFVLRPKSGIHYKFLFYYLQLDEFNVQMEKLQRGTSYPAVTDGDIRNQEIYYPNDFSEQHRIVALLDEAFAAIAKARANTEKNLLNAKQLFKSYLEGAFINLGENWQEKQLGEVCEFQNGQAHEKEIDENGKYILVNSKFISTEGEIYKRTDSLLSPLNKGDIVMVMSDVPNGKALAKCFLIDQNNTYTLNQRICVIRSKNFENRFLFFQLNRHKYLLSFNNGENQTNLRKNDILSCPLFIPPLEIQNDTISKLDSIQAETKKLEAHYLQKLANLEELKKSILQKAFRGELTEKEIVV
ncbi:MAG: restriction endonuclease subunit S [Cyclobacteriaceae bacterium]